VKQGNQ